MTLSVWRYAHLALALVSSVFLLILSVTGVILAIGAVQEKTHPYRIDNFESVNLAQSIPVLYGVFPEITEINIDHNQFVSIDATDKEGNSIKAYIDPTTGKILGEVVPQSDFIQWNTALHRSLFLKETGRILVGVVSFLLFLITITGTLLIIKRQQGVRNFFAQIKKDFFAQYFHVVSGRLFLVPVLLLALTGTYLFMVRIGIFSPSSETISYDPIELPAVKAADFPIFKETLLADVSKIEFPFIPDDPEESYILKLKGKEITVNQITGQITEEIKHSAVVDLEILSLNLHTGRTNAIWAIILGLASLNILFFIYTGFEITFRRKGPRIKNKYTAENASYIILVGTENGSTLSFANKIHEQLLHLGYNSFLTEMNRFSNFPQAQHFLIFTSTYGLGTAPANAIRFSQLLARFVPENTVQYSVIGFGSKAYPDFCAYAAAVDRELEQQPWASRYLDFHTINDRSAEELIAWIRAWNQKSSCNLATTPALYATRITGLRKFRIQNRTRITEGNATFILDIQPESRQAFQSGDLLAVYPAGDGRERLYSIAKNGTNIQLVVKLHPNGLGSEYLYNLAENTTFSARIVRNLSFHFPDKAPKVAMIANGTGIAPFLGMIRNNRKKAGVHLYAGFRHRNELTDNYQSFASEEREKGHLQNFRIAYSREENKQYVLDLIREDLSFFTDLLENKGVVMICGSLAMQKDVEIILAEAVGREIQSYKSSGQILTDCY